jgi:hypothetical protein
MIEGNSITFAGVIALIFVASIIKPQIVAYIFLFANPLIVGIARGEVIPLVRPNEMLLIFLLLAMATRGTISLLSGRPVTANVSRIDLGIVAMAVASSIIPVLVRMARGLPVTNDDLLYSLVLWKYYALYRLFRSTIAHPSQVRLCLAISTVSAAAVSLLAILQVENLFGVPQFLYDNYDQPFEGHQTLVTDRATSTIASSFGLADLMIMNFAVAVALAGKEPRFRWFLIACAGLFVSGCIVAGEFSGFIGLGVALVALGVISGRLRRLVAAGAPTVLLASMMFGSVITQRLSGFEEPSGLPHSWSGRWENLRDFFLPEILSNFGWLFGVRPAARLPAPETWRNWVYIECGYVWLIWIGGLPFLISFFYFVWTAAQDLWQVARARADAIGVAASATFAHLMVMVMLMLFDPHLTVRGSADLFFPLLALSFTCPRELPRRTSRAYDPGVRVVLSNASQPAMRTSPRR